MVEVQSVNGRCQVYCAVEPHGSRSVQPNVGSISPLVPRNPLSAARYLLSVAVVAAWTRSARRDQHEVAGNVIVPRAGAMLTLPSSIG